jgi:hypothetical protein
MAKRIPGFVRDLYFGMQTIDGVKSLEIWNGIREFGDPFEKTSLIKNLYKVVVPLVNETHLHKPFELHSLAVKGTVSGLLAGVCGGSSARIFELFPDPPVGETTQKTFYHLIKDEAKALVENAVSQTPLSTAAEQTPPDTAQTEKKKNPPGIPDTLFDFREMRIVDNELPYIIFTDKEYRVIQGLAIAYFWLLDVQSMFLATLEENGIDKEIPEEYRRFAQKVLKENPLTIKGEKMDPRELAARLRGKPEHEDYLDVFENVFSWFESAQARFKPTD